MWSQTMKKAQLSQALAFDDVKGMGFIVFQSIQVQDGPALPAVP